MRRLTAAIANPLQTRAGVSGSDGRFEFRELLPGVFHVSESETRTVRLTAPP